MISALAELLLAAQLTIAGDAAPKTEVPAAGPRKAEAVRTVEPLTGTLAKLNMSDACCNPTLCTCGCKVD